MKKSSPLFVAGLIATLVMASYGGFVFFKHQGALESLEKHEIVVSELENKVLKLEQDRVLEAISAKKTADQISQDAVMWSEIIKKLRKIIPKDDGEPIALITSYTGSRSSGISLSIETVSGRDEPYLDVADFIEAFSESEEFEGSFVPGISSGLDERGEEVLTFSMNTVYLGDDFLIEDDLGAALDQVLDEALNEDEDESEAVLR